MDIRLVVSEAIESAKPRAEAKSIELSQEMDGPVVVDGDRRRLAEIADNLVSNAVKYTPEGGRVVTRVQRDGDEARLEVSDTGIGIAAEELPHLFGRFYRTKAARDAAIPGSGLGLAITRALVASHRGVIDVNSEPGTGSTFRVRLPAVAN